jgi:hypothetical protein
MYFELSNSAAFHLLPETHVWNQKHQSEKAKTMYPAQDTSPYPLYVHLPVIC